MINPDEYNLQRYINAQQSCYAKVKSELSLGQKKSHWMWFIFPQIRGLGFSEMAQYYAIQNLQEAQHYFNHPLLGMRLIECSKLVYQVRDKTIEQIFAQPDTMKFLSCMTLFSELDSTSHIFSLNIERYFNHQKDQKTVQLLS